MVKTYCLKEGKLTENINPKIVRTVNERIFEKNQHVQTVGYGPLYNPYKCHPGVCLATCRSLNNVYTATGTSMARNTVRPVYHLDC